MTPRKPATPKRCPYCKAGVKRESRLVPDWCGRDLVWSFMFFQCGTSMRPGQEPMAGSECPSYVPAYPLPPHLAAIHAGGRMAEAHRRAYR